jgi:hypothetical protein
MMVLDRPEIIIKTQGVKTVVENIAYNYSITKLRSMLG